MITYRSVFFLEKKSEYYNIIELIKICLQILWRSNDFKIQRSEQLKAMFKQPNIYDILTAGPSNK
jgi:hypothetical protein